MKHIINITLDGPSASGKTTIARELALDLGLAYVDTGAMYRGIAYYMLSSGIDTTDAAAVESKVGDISMHISYAGGEQHVVVNDEDVTAHIREPEVSMGASNVGKVPAVRLKLVELQRDIAKQNSCILDGRDIGSYVLPNAEYKFYLTASDEVRAQRRYDELKVKNPSITLEEVANDIKKRDKQDSSRSFAPLVIPNGAVYIDTSTLSLDEVKMLIKDKLYYLKDK